jgi:hypothetical protein
LSDLLYMNATIKAINPAINNPKNIPISKEPAKVKKTVIRMKTGRLNFNACLILYFIFYGLNENAKQPGQSARTENRASVMPGLARWHC